MIFSDATRLRQVVVNLMGNALKFTAKGRIELKVRADADMLRFEVRDTGIGMTPEVVSRLFQPFAQGDSSTTRRFGGTGLGLAICKRLIELMGGEISVESTAGEGSTFSFTIPLTELPPAKYVPRTEMQTMTLPGMHPRARNRPGPSRTEYPLRILVAEDNSTNMKVALLLLQRLGYRGDPVRNGVECLEAVRRLPYDVILMDMQMPEMDGIECTRHLRAEGNNIRVIALTADALIDAQGRCLAGRHERLRHQAHRARQAGARPAPRPSRAAQERRQGARPHTRQLRRRRAMPSPRCRSIPRSRPRRSPTRHTAPLYAPGGRSSRSNPSPADFVAAANAAATLPLAPVQEAHSENPSVATVRALRAISGSLPRITPSGPAPGGSTADGQAAEKPADA